MQIPISAHDTNPVSGPFIDVLVFKIIPDENQRILALLNDQIDVIGTGISPSDLSQLESSNEIETAMTPNNKFGYFSINTDKYPFNITAFRRAIAYALDKNFIAEQIWDGFAVPQDAPLPSFSAWSAEYHIEEHYYAANIERGNQLLDSAGFLDVDADGFREAPDGTDFDIDIETDHTSNASLQIGYLTEAACRLLGLDATNYPTDFWEYLPRVARHGSYDMAFIEETPDTYDVSWLAENFHSARAAMWYYNFPNFRNATFDSWYNSMIYSTEYDDVLEAAIEMQKILVYQCPIIICYVSSQISAYRTDRFEGYVNDFNSGIGSWWTYYNVHMIGGSDGGTLRTSMLSDPSSFNLMQNPMKYDILGWDVLGTLYDSLIILDPAGSPLPWLAKSYNVETNAVNPDVFRGYTRLTFDLVRNASWSDGTLLTAEDVAFTLNYYLDSTANPYNSGLSDLMAAYASGPYQVIVEFDTESYWHLLTVGAKPIIPKHIFTEIGLDGWDMWDPAPSDETLVTSGPFELRNHAVGEFVELKRNPSYFRRPLSSTTTTTNSSEPTIEEWQSQLIIASGAMSITIVVFVLAIMLHKRNVKYSSQFAE
jgi:ABC-type transport system substrate-binding protein